MASLSRAQIAAYARAAGFPEDQIATAVAVAMAESSGNPSARNASSATGLFQILIKAHPDLAAKYDLTDPGQNAKAAYDVWKAAGGKWSPWSTYNSGSYRRYYSTDGLDSGTTEQPVPRDTTNTVANAFTDPFTTAAANNTLAAQLGFIGTQAFWQRFGIGALGVGLVILGIVVVFRRPIGVAVNGTASLAKTAAKIAAV